MITRVKVPTLSVNIDLSLEAAKDLLPLLRQGGAQECWPLQQRQTFNSLVGKLEETLKIEHQLLVQK